MTEQSSPLYLKELLMKIKMKNGIGIDDDLNKLLSTIDLHHLPKPFVHGKKCSNCDHRMHCKSLRCPKCHCEMRKRKREEGGEIEEESKNECDGSLCSRDISNERAIILPCNHKYCVKCLTTWVVTMEFITCCSCRDVRIPEEIINELKHNE
jgi:hypothetical protein